MAGRLRQPDITGNDGAEQLILEVALNLRADLDGKAGPAIEHGKHDPLHVQAGVGAVPDQAQRLHELGQPLEGIVLALERDDGGVGGDQRVEGEEPEGRRAVDQDEGEPGADRRQCLPKPALAARRLDQLDLGADQVGASREQVQVGESRRAARLLGGDVFEEDFVDGRAEEHSPLGDHSRGRVTLGVEIHEEGRPFRRGQGRGEIDCRGRLADPAFLVHDAQDAGHAPPLFHVEHRPGSPLPGL